MSGRFKASVGNSVEPTPRSFKIVNIVMWYDCIRKLKGHAFMTMRKGKVCFFFFKNTKRNWTRQSLLVVSSFLTSTRTWPLHFGDPARTCQWGDLFDLKHPQKMFTCVNRIWKLGMCSYRSLVASTLVRMPHSFLWELTCIWNGSIVLMRVALAELFQFFPELLNSGGSRRYIFVEFVKRKVEDYGRAIRSGRAPASTWIEVLQHWSEWFGGAGSAFKRGV